MQTHTFILLKQSNKKQTMAVTKSSPAIALDEATASQLLSQSVSHCPFA